MEWRMTIFRLLSPVYCHFNIFDITGPSFKPTLLQHTTIFLVNDQLDAQILFYVFISIYNSACFQHIVLIIRRDKLY